MSTKCTIKKFEFLPLKKRKVIVNFEGGHVTSDVGSHFLKMADSALNLISSAAKKFADKRQQSKITHTIESMIKQRVFAIANGYEDVNDHETLRHDKTLQVLVGSDRNLASPSTLNRFENVANRDIAVEINKTFVEAFIKSHESPPEKLIFDFDATDDLVHGKQEGSFFHVYYGNTCFLPLYVFCGSHLLIAYLRPSNKDQAKHSWAILSLLVKRFRKEWPEVKIIFRGDSGFCRHKMFDWCEKNNLFYITGIGGNNVLKTQLQPQIEQAKDNYEKTNEKQRLFKSFRYAAGSWNKERKIIGKAEHTSKGANPRFIVTNLKGDPKDLYDNYYCARGDMENRIKEQHTLSFC